MHKTDNLNEKYNFLGNLKVPKVSLFSDNMIVCIHTKNPIKFIYKPWENSEASLVLCHMSNTKIISFSVYKQPVGKHNDELCIV
jgi:hypothetical protein